MSNFVTNCLKGDALLDDIDDYVDEWHETNGKIPLHQYLGMSRTEYALWVADPDVLPFVIAAHREKRDVGELLEEFNALPLAARAEGPEKANELMHWLKKEGLWK
ncbi:MAG TPA: hypothetical protein VIY48_19710 [Candidatus Paceibacterota bacterium]